MAGEKPKQNVKTAVALSDEKPVFEWKTLEFIQNKKSSAWFLIILIVAVCLIVFFVWQKNWTAVGVAAVAAAALFAQSSMKPKTLDIALFRGGIVIDEKAYPFSQFKSFWMVAAELPQARFQQIGRFAGHVTLPIGEDEDPEQIRLFLAKYLPEDENKGEDLADVIQRWTRF